MFLPEIHRNVEAINENRKSWEKLFSKYERKMISEMATRVAKHKEEDNSS